MEQVRAFMQEVIAAGAYKVVLGGPVDKAEKYRKVTVSKRGDGYFCERLTKTQAFHKAIAQADIEDFLVSAFEGYTHANAFDGTREYSARRTKGGKLLTSRKACNAAPRRQDTHNREKRYILEEKRIVPPLVDMGVMAPDGSVNKTMFDKFRQINRYLEIIDDVVRAHDLQSLSIIDFGCGKSYLTFIVYYYLTEIRGIQVQMTGVDLKEDVIAYCQRLAEKYGYSGLSFVQGDIADYEKGGREVDMVISLHACDTATDYALYNAVRWGARFIFAVPCCQHELAGQVRFDKAPIFDAYGLVKERVAALMTDSLRAQMLTACGYKTQVMEFVDLCHTPKNILLRAQRDMETGNARQKAREVVQEISDMFGVKPTLYRLLRENDLMA